MVTFSLDASSVLRYVDNEPGASRIKEILDLHAAGSAAVVISAIHWAEVIGTCLKRFGEVLAPMAILKIELLPFEVVPVSRERAVRAAQLRYRYKLPFADSFGVELAGDSPDHILVTADFDVKPAANDIQIAFLPTKPRA